jgi:hypothetical protein
MAQARAAGELAAAFETARKELAEGRPGPMEAPVHRAILRALGHVAGRYRALAAASLLDDRKLYNRTAFEVRRAESELGEAVRMLARLV